MHVKEWFAVRHRPLCGKTGVEWLALFRAADIAAGPVHRIKLHPGPWTDFRLT
jgi:hypothetical protein